MVDENWLKFEKSGKIADYLAYHAQKPGANAVKLDEKAWVHADNNKGTCHKRTVSGGE